ncbi:hypothetical protein FJZ33_00100 [Candidatus Poribacteria bacterium]|nr:hypothetical protein [Candidatus Poribacteria bacterium]
MLCRTPNANGIAEIKENIPKINFTPKPNKRVKREAKMGGALTMSDVKPIEPIIQKEKKVNSVTMKDVPERSLLQQYIDNLYDNDGRLKKDKFLYEHFPAGIWRNKRCFIIGGGPSLKGFDFSQLKGELVITVNRGFEYFPSAINVCQDARVFGFYENREFKEGDEARKKFYDYKGYKSWLNVQAFPFPEDIYQIGIVHPADFNYTNYSGGIPPYNNSGLNALCLAVCLGANPIYLLGFDCKGKDGRTANFHSGYLDTNKEEIYLDFIRDFNYVSGQINGKTRVVNLNPDSAIKCFEFGEMKDIQKIKRPILVSFFTKGTGYELEIKRLERSAIKFGFEYDFYPQENLGSWRANIHDRIRILKHFLNKHPDRDILYIDADGEVQQYPELFDNFEGDFGIVKIDRSKYWDNWKEWHHEREEYLGGTMYLKNNRNIRNLLDLWDKLDAPMETKLSQHTLINAIRKMGDKLNIRLLPLTYCQIFDTMVDEGEPIVEHFQASRRSILYIKLKEDGTKYLDFTGANLKK